MKSLQDRAIVVTGAGRGLGRGYARLIVAEGGQVVVNDIDRTCAETVAQELRDAGGAAIATDHDIVDPSQAGELIDACVGRFGRIDGLVNNAGVFHTSPPWDEETDRARRLVEVNVLGTLFCGIHAIRLMRHQGSGAIVNVTSGASLGMPAMGAYGASKGAVTSMTYSWALDTHTAGIRVNAVSPIAYTRMTESIGAARGNHPLPEQIAPVVAFLLSHQAVGITGQVVRLDGRRLSLLDPATFGAGGVEGAEWDVAAIGEAFRSGALGALRPVGSAGARLT